MQQVTKHRLIIIVLILMFVISGTIYAGSKDIKDMNFKGADIRDVLRAVSEVAGVNMVTDGSVKGNITIHLKSISFQKALDLITQSLGLDYKWDGNTVVVATPKRIKEIYEKKDIELVILKNNDLQRIKSIVKNIYPELNIQVDAKNEQLIIVGSGALIEKALILIEDIKYPEKNQEEAAKVKEVGEVEIVTEIVKIKYSNPENILRNIKDIYSGLKLSSNIENQQIIMNGEKELVKKAKELVIQLDIAKEETAKAEKVTKNVDMESQEIKEIMEKKEYIETVAIANANMKLLKEEILNIEPELMITIDNINEQLIITGYDKSKVKKAKSLAQKWDNKQVSDIKVVRVDYVDIANVKTIVANLHPDVSLHINNGVREIIVRGKTKDINEVAALIAKLDVPRKQVIIEARVEEVSSSKLKEIGVNPNNFSNIHFIKDSNNQITDVELTWPDFLDAMKKQGAAETLARPRLVTLNGEKAKMLIGQRIPVKMVNTEGETSIKYIEAGITLEFEPWITRNNEIELNIQPKVSSLGEELYAGYPSIKTREVETNLRLKDGETFAIGGLIQEDESESMSEVPVLSEIPILGEIFKNNNIEKSRTELLIFITPKIVNDEFDNINQKNEINTDNNEENKTEVSKKKVIKDEEKKVVKTELKSKSDILTGNEVEKIINYSRRERMYDSEDGLPDSLNIFYRVKAEEKVDEIADFYGIITDSIIDINKIEKKLEENDLITLAIPHDHLYRIKWGETLYQLAKRYNVKLEKLEEINKIGIETNIPGNFIIIFPKPIK